MKKVWLLTLFLGISAFAFAQESSCNDGVDNDGDGFIDCFDGDCANSANCSDSYIGKDKLCQSPPPAGNKFKMALKKKSPVVTTTHGRFVVGDMGGPGGKDGIPEVVTVHASTKKFSILNGIDLTVKASATAQASPERYDIAIGNVNNDGCAEAYFVENDNGTFYVSCYDCQANLVWREKAYSRPFILNLADIDGDGKTEIYYRNEIRDAATGQRLVKGSGDWMKIDAGPVAVDMLDDGACADCAGLELVLGGEIFSVKLPTGRGAGDTDAGSIVSQKKFNDIPSLGGIKYFPKAINLGGASFVNSQTSIADYNLDGSLDVLMTGAASSGTGDPITIFYWDVKNSTFKTYQPQQSNGTGWQYGAGRLNVADLDGDGKMNVAFVSGSRLFALDENLNVLKIKSKLTGLDSAVWIKTISEVSSGFTSTTVFDFNNDNASEIVYRDEDNVYIFNGKTGVASPPVSCTSLTTNDYPIVTDVDADGSTEICVVCQDSGGDSDDGVIRTYKSALEPWVSARRVWNQHAYFNVNVNDDLSIPKLQQKHHLVFSENICTPGQKNRALNSFLNQSAILDSKGCKTYPTADIIFQPNPNLINVVQPTCPDKDFKVSFTIKNIGDISLSGNFPVTFYSGDPRLTGAVKLNTITVALTNFKPGDLLSVNNQTVNGTGKTFTLFAVLNDAGTTVPTPITLPNSGFMECNYSNNVVSAPVKPGIFALSTLTTNQIQCTAATTPPNGSAKAFKQVGATQQTVGFTFYWFNGTTAGDSTTAVYKGPLRSPIINGQYTVYAAHNAFRCGSDTVTVTVGLTSKTIGATVKVDASFTDCKNPDGQLSVKPNTGNTGDYTYKWFEGTVFGTSQILSNTNILKDVKGLTYSVLVTEKTTGCETIASGTVPDQTVKPVVTATSTAALCSPANSGKITASVGGATSSYTFRWYNGASVKPSADATGTSYSNLVAGDYTVIAKRNSTGCDSNPLVVQVAPSPSVVVTATINSHETSCAAPNGSITASVNGSASGISFKWFKGNTTSGTSFSSNATITGQKAGTYTVEATRASTGCVDTEVVTLDLNKVIPDVVASTLSDQSNCSPLNGSVTAVASVATGPFRYYWFNGTVGTPDTTVANFKASATFSSRPAGTYTVVAVDKVSRCASPKAVATVANTTVIPVITTSTVSQTNCSGTANGSASADVAGGTNGFKFRWFTGSDTTSFITQSPTLSNRAAGTYTVKAQNLVTKCFSTKVVTISNTSAKPVLSLGKTDNSICSAAIGFNGSATSTLTSNPNGLAGHTMVYEWKRNTVVIPGATNSLITAIDGGTYAVTVTNQTLGCTSDPVSVTVNNTTTLPVLVTAPTASTNCTPALANGAAELTKVDNVAIGSVTGYTYQWHTGTGTASPIAVGTNASADDPKLLNLQGGPTANFTVLVTKTSTGCQNTATVLVTDAKILPALSLAVVNNSICDPNLTPAVGDNYNGKITATVTNQVGTLSNYNFVFAAGMGPGNQTANVFDNLNGGPTAYTVVATHTPTGCQSTVSNAQVQNIQDIPDLTTSAVASTNCTAALVNGSARVVTVDTNPATTTGFTYAWTGPAGFSVTGNATNDDIILTSVQGGAGFDYTVLVTNLSNGCQNTAIVNVPDAKVIPSLSLAVVNNTMCDPTLTPAVGDNFNGRITATITNQVGAIGNYNFTFGAGMGAGNQTANVFDNLNGGPTAYTVSVLHTPTGCQSVVSNAQVQNLQDTPDLTTSSIASTNCTTPALANGSARVVNVDGIAATTTGFTFAWTGPAGFSVTGNATNDDIILTNVQGGAGFDYTVQVTNLTNGCRTSTAVNVADAKVIPTLSLAVVNNSICDPALTPAVGDNYNGKITATVTNQVGLLANYNFTFGAGMGPGAQTANVFDNLNGGPTSYTASVIHTPTGCQSTVSTAQVQNIPDLPDLTTSSIASTSCDLAKANGSARVVTVDGNPATTTGFTFAWTGPAGFSVVGNTTNDDIILTNVQGGATFNYNVLVTNLSNGCTNTASVNVSDASALPLLTLTPTPNTICDPVKATAGPGNFNGQVQAVVSNLGALNINDYMFDWSVNTADGLGSTLLQHVDVGNYTVSATHNPTGCASTVYSAQVTNSKQLPVIDIRSNPSQNCAGGAADGLAFVNGVTPVGTYGYKWYDGNMATGTVKDTDANYQNVQGGSLLQYTVEVTILETGCLNTATVGVADDSEVPVLGTLVGTDNTHCNAAKDGTATISTLTYRGAAGTLTDFTFNWSGGLQGPAQTITTLAPGNYSLTVTHNDDKCVSNPMSVTIGDNLYLPVVNIAEVPQTSCNTLTPNGILTATINENVVGGPGGGMTVSAGYSFAWTNRGNPYSAVVTPAPNVHVANGINQLVGNKFYEVTATRTLTGCSSVKSHLLTEDIELPQFTLGGMTAQTSCVPPNGSATATVTSPAVTTDFTYFWLREVAGQTTNNATTVITNVLAPTSPHNKAQTTAAMFSTNNNTVSGQYTVVIRDNFTNCLSQTKSIVIDDNTASTITLNAGSIPSSCSQVGTIEISATRVGPPPSTQFDFEVFRGGPTNTVSPIDYYSTPANPPQFASATPVDNVNNVPDNTVGVTTSVAIISDLYTIVATDDYGCKSYKSYFLPYQDAHGIDIDLTNVTNCTTGNGAVAMNAIFPPTGPGIVNNQSDYTFTFYSGGSTANLVQTVVPAATFADPYGAATNPSAWTVSTEVCNNAIDDDGDGKGDATDEDCIGKITASSLPTGFYLLEVTDILTGCNVYESVEIKQDARPAVVDVVSLTANTACDLTVANGSAVISVTKDPADAVMGVTYSIDVAPDPSAYPVALGAFPIANHTINGLQPSTVVPTYTATVTSNNGCTTVETFSIQNQPVVGQLLNSNIAVTDTEYCTPGFEQSAKIVVNSVVIPAGSTENITDYRFEWYADAGFVSLLLNATGDAAMNTGGDELKNQVPTMASGTVPAGTVTVGDYYLKAVKITDASLTGGIGCTTAPFAIFIGQNTVNPDITLTPTPDTACDPNPAIAEGSIEVDVVTATGPGNGGNYSYVWTPNGGLGQPANSGVNNGNSNMQNGINNGIYSLTAQNLVTGCSSSTSTEVLLGHPPVFTLDATPNNVTFCSAPFNGNVNALQVFVDGMAGTVSDFDYVWYKTSPATTPVIDGTNAGVADDTQLTFITYPAIDIGTYYVKAIRKVAGGRGCESAPITRVIQDNRVTPNLSFNTVATTACDANHDGRITVTATTPSGPGMAAPYNFVWTNDPDGLAGTAFSASNSPTINTASPFSTLSSDKVGEGAYSIRVTNFVTGCFSDGNVNVTKASVPMSIVSVTPTHVDLCSALNGAGTIDDASYKNVAGNTTLFKYTWDDDAAFGSPFITDDAALTQGSLNIGTYYVRGKLNEVISPMVPGVSGSGCLTPVVPFTVLDKRITPTVSFATVATTACDNNHDGRITVTATTASGPGVGSMYDFKWTNDPDGLAGTAFRASDASPLASPYVTPNTDLIGQGTYAIRVKNLGTECFTDATVNVVKQALPMSIVTVIPTHVNVCSTPPDGSATITDANFNGVTGAAGIASFTYTWADNAALASPFAAAGASIATLDDGNYFVRGTRGSFLFPMTPGITGSGCNTAIVPFTVLDKRITPTVSSVTVSTSACDNNHDGQITVIASTASGPGVGSPYDFVWTDDPDHAGTVFSATSSTGTASPYLTPNTDKIGEGVYAIRVTNTTTACFTDATVNVGKKTIPMAIVNVNPTHVDHCDTPNGAAIVTDVSINGVGGNSASFTYTWANNVAMTTPILANSGTVAIGPPTNPLDIGNYFVQAQRRAPLAPPGTPGTTGSGCLTAPVPFTILDRKVTPTLAFTTTPSTACDNDFDGRIRTIAATASGPGIGANYNFVWTNDPDGLAGTGFSATNGMNQVSPYQTPTTDLVGPGTYTIRVTNLNTQCFADGTATVLKNTVPIEILTATGNPQQRCTVPGDGSVAVALADVRVNNATVASGITFAWEDGAAASIGAGTLVTNLNAGSYFVKATRSSGSDPGSGCVSAPFKVEVKDLRQFPVVRFTTVNNTSCDNNFDGAITVTSTTTGLGSASAYNLNWTSNPGGAVVVSNATGAASPYTTLATDKIGAGPYSVRVMNVLTSCATDASVTVDQKTPTLSILSVAKVDQRDCIPFDGSITVTGSNPAHLSVTGTYTFAWEKAGTPVIPTGPNNVISQIDAGNYTVMGTKVGGPGSGCQTPVFPVEILDLRVNPAVDLLSLANIACNTNFTGEISATVTEGATPGFTAGYNYQWFTGTNDVPANIIGGATANSMTNIQQGDYAVRVTDSASPGMGCFTVATLPVGFDPTNFTSTLSTITQTICSPTPNGVVSVLTITEKIANTTTTFDMALPADRTKFSFQWFDDTTAPLTAVVNGGNSLSNVVAAKYLVQITDDATGCTSTMDNAIIEDETAHPFITLDDFLNPTICLLPETSGFMQVSADNSLNFSDYKFKWFVGSDTTGTVAEPNNPTLANILESDPDVYTVKVTNRLNNCFTMETFTVQTDTVTLRPIASAVPLTSCAVNNGSLFAAMQQGNGNLYNYEWYAGTTIDGTPDFTGKEILTAPLGLFTVVAKHPNAAFAFCPSIPDTTTVLNGRLFPPVEIQQLNPLTYCDPTNANGVAKATVNGSDLGYTFDWYAGNTATGTSFYTGSEAAGLHAITYTVNATDLVSQCATAKSITIDNQPVPVPSPSVIILSHRTNCITPDGALTATVNGNTVDFTIQWYDGSSVKSSTDADGEFYRDLDVGPYTTTATDVVSGCVSAPVVTEILPFMELPEFDIETTPTYCEQTVGTAKYIAVNDVVIESIFWDIDGGVHEGNIITDLPKGTFTVTATSVTKCVNTKTFEILPEILVFNGISKNGDGKNDFFEISCIEDFPNNTVKIFNRAGTLVYQHKGYNNADIMFDGVSNEGLSLMGRDLPDGTYFYIIDKGDGSKPRTGYLELLRTANN